MTLPALAEEGVDLAQGVGGVVERDEEALGAVLARHDRLETVDVGAADLVLLLDLDRIPVVEELLERGRLAGKSETGGIGFGFLGSVSLTYRTPLR